VSTDVDLWWEHLRATALVGTARREVPPSPDLGPVPRPGAGREQALLDAAALGDAVRRAGRLPEPAPADPDDAAPGETLPTAPPTAVQVLELLFTQGPVGQAARGTLTVHWLETAAAAGRIVPPRLLPALLAAATPQSPVRRGVRPVLGERGRWLAARNPAWDWAPEVVEDSAPSPEGVRARVEATWDTAPAAERAAAVAALVVGLGPEDEPFLERCLDDRAKAVREEAQRLLDRLPGSARAARMADRLRPLVAVSGALRKSVEVRLPDDPDAAAVRDGLSEAAPGGSRRVRWMQQVVGATPLSVWSELARAEPGKVLGMLRSSADVVPGLRHATIAQGDVDWARALLALGPDPSLLALVPAPERESVLVRSVRDKPLSQLTLLLQTAPRPWGPDLSRAVLAAIGRDKEGGHAVRVLRDVLPTAVHPSTLPDVEKAMKAAGDDGYVRTALRDVLQFQSLHRSISEAFR
jgi:hypothetical protein